jgi:hypothetical protein
MTYYVVRVRTPDQQTHSLVFVLNKDQNLMDQVIAKVGDKHLIISINILGHDWP